VGRNTAAREAKNDIIACTDIGCILDKGWLKNIIQPFEENEKVMVVSGFFKAAPKTFFERVSSTFMLTDHDNINSDEWLPSSRSIAYKKEAWQKAGGYPENMNLNEDTPFALAFKKAGYKFYFAQNAIVYWRPRPNIKEFFKQYYSYAKGDGQGLIHWKNYLARTIKYLVGIVLIILGFWIYIFWILAILAFLYYITKRSIRVWRTIPGIKTFFLVTFLILIDDIAELFGFWIGLLKNKLKNRK
jgi:cellulose synthase/poly-beta-1,6-N-acetylglucosamine synthase-like glycosyltransferase